MKKNKTLLIVLLLLLTLISSFNRLDAHAVAGGFTMSGPTTLAPGETATYTVTYSSPVKTTFYFKVGVSNGTGNLTVSDPGADSTGTTYGQRTFTVTAGSSGTISLYIDSQENLTVDTLENVSLAGGLDVAIVSPTPTPEPTPEPTPTPEPKPETRSDNYYLSSMSVTPGGLQPGFTQLNDLYQVNLPAGTTSYTVSGTLADSKATIIAGVGTFEPFPYNFRHTVRVQAENGAVWEYYIDFVVDDDRSSDSSLSSLSVSTGQLSPTFSKDVFEYTVEVPAETKTVNLDAKATDDKATVEGLGEVTVVEGETVTKEVVVTAENETTSTYTIHFKVSEKPAQTIKVDGKTYTFEAQYPEDLVKLGFKLKTDLAGFEKGTPYYESAKGDYKAIYLNDGQASSWYVIDDEKKLSPITLITLGDKIYAFMDLPDELKSEAHMSLKELKLGDKTISGWVSNEAKLKDFQLLYLMDESGEFDYFLAHKDQPGLMKVGDYRLAEVVKEEAVTETVEEPVKAAIDESLIFLIISLISIIGIAIVILLYRYYKNRN